MNSRIPVNHAVLSPAASCGRVWIYQPLTTGERNPAFSSLSRCTRDSAFAGMAHAGSSACSTSKDCASFSLGVAMFNHYKSIARYDCKTIVCCQCKIIALWRRKTFLQIVGHRRPCCLEPGGNQQNQCGIAVQAPCPATAGQNRCELCRQGDDRIRVTHNIVGSGYTPAVRHLD